MLIDPEKDALGNEDDVPDAIAAYRALKGITKKFYCEIKKRVGETPWRFVFNYKHEVPDTNTIAKMYGPGEYQLNFMWKEHKPGGGTVACSDVYEFEIAEHPWKAVHLRYIAEEEQRIRDEEKNTLSRLRTKAEMDAIAEGKVAIGGAMQKSDLDMLMDSKKKLEAIGVQIGGGGGFSLEKIVGYAALLAPIITPIFQNMREAARSREDFNAKLMLAMITSKSGDGDMNRVMEGVLKMAGLAANVKDTLLPPPEEKEGVLDKIFGVVEVLGPKILEMAMQSRQARAGDPLWNLAANSPQIKAVAASPEMQMKLVQKLDTTYGFQNANEILKAMEEVGVRRPAELADNWKLYPSEGWDKQGIQIGAKSPLDGE